MRGRISFLPLLLLLGVIGLLNGCGGGTINIPAPITVTLSTGSNITVQEGQSITITASITSDTTGAGLSWSIIPVTGCGTYLLSNDTTLTYTAPLTSCTVTVRATSIADPSKTASTLITVE